MPIRPSDLIDPWTGEQLPPILSVREAAHLLKQHEQTILQRCRSGDLEVMSGRQPCGPWRIKTVPLLREMGMLPETLDRPSSPTQTAPDR